MDDFMKPIIEAYYTQMKTEFDNEVLRATQAVGINVDKERLLQALQDARAFWHEGYAAGRKGEPRWIPVEERLPEPGQMVLVYCDSRMRTVHVTVSTYMQTYSKVRRCYWSRRIKNVTHWMPLPEPPEVDG